MAVSMAATGSGVYVWVAEITYKDGSEEALRGCYCSSVDRITADGCPATAVRQPLSDDRCPTTAVRRPLSDDRCPACLTGVSQVDVR